MTKIKAPLGPAAGRQKRLGGERAEEVDAEKLRKRLRGEYPWAEDLPVNLDVAPSLPRFAF